MLAVCAAVLMINLSSEKWNKFDLETKVRAEKTCIKRYNSCLKKFIKKERKIYNAICGG